MNGEDFEQLFTAAQSSHVCTDDCCTKWGNHYRQEARTATGSVYRVRIGTPQEALVSVEGRGVMAGYCPAHLALFEEMLDSLRAAMVRR